MLFRFACERKALRIKGFFWKFAPIWELFPNDLHIFWAPHKLSLCRWCSIRLLQPLGCLVLALLRYVPWRIFVGDILLSCRPWPPFQGFWPRDSWGWLFFLKLGVSSRLSRPLVWIFVCKEHINIALLLLSESTCWCFWVVWVSCVLTLWCGD